METGCCDSSLEKSVKRAVFPVTRHVPKEAGICLGLDDVDPCLLLSLVVGDLYICEFNVHELFVIGSYVQRMSSEEEKNSY